MPLPELIVVPVDPEHLQDAEALASLMHKAAFLCARSEAAEFPCQLSVVSVVYEPMVDWSVHAAKERERFKSALLAHVQEQLDSAIAQSLVGSGITVDKVTTTVLWGERSWRMVLDHAESRCADMIIWPEQQTAWRRGSKSPDEWQLARHTSIPVLFSQSAGWHEPTAVVVAMDAFSGSHDPLNALLLQRARTLATLLAGHIYVVSTFPELRPLTLNLGLLDDYAAQAEKLSAQGTSRIRQALSQAGIANAVVDVRAGSPVAVITEVVDRIGPAAVVLGTHARSGISAAVLGNTCEKLLHGLGSDLLVVPGA
ncbi:MAG: universal stress protein [Pseudomonadales bacterium]